MGNQLHSLSEIFTNRFFRVPDYQRGYSWQENQLNDFWEDILNISKNRFHYTGMLTIEEIPYSRVENDNNWQNDLWMFNKGYKSFYIVDGQQRMTTIIILLKVLFDKFDDDEEINNEEKADLIKRYLYQSGSKGNNFSFIFGYEKDDPSNEYFISKILEKESFKSANIAQETLYTNNLISAKNFFAGNIKKLPKSELENILNKVTINLKFNLYEIDNDLDVFVTFETMNNRGKPLSKLELLKNRLIYLSTLLHISQEEKNSLRTKINETWKTIYYYLGKNIDYPLDDDEFLNNHWIMYFKYERKEGEAFSKFLLNEYFIAKNILNKDCEIKISIEEIEDYVSSLSKSVVKWYDLHNPSAFDRNTELYEWLEKLDRLGLSYFRPLGMAALLLSKNEDLLVKLFQAIERFVYLVFVVSKRMSSKGNNYYYQLANKFYKKEITLSHVIREIESGIDEYFNWDKFVAHMDDLDNSFYDWNGIDYFLYEYESHLRDKAKGVDKVKWSDVIKNYTEKVTIEHIYPQNSSKKCWNFGLNDKEQLLYKNSLGNLLLLSQPKNSQLQNECFDFKNKHTDKKGNISGYYNGSYSEIEVAQYSKWTPEEIKSRGLKLLEFMENRWMIDIENKLEVLGLSKKK